MKKFLFFVLIPIYVPIILFLNFTQKWWESLAD